MNTTTYIRDRSDKEFLTLNHGSELTHQGGGYMKPENSLDLEFVELSSFGLDENSTPPQVHMMYAKNARAVPELRHGPHSPRPAAACSAHITVVSDLRAS